MFVKFAACMKLRKYDLHARNLGFGVNVGGNAASVILDGNAPVLVYMHVDRIGIAVRGLVDCIIHDFPKNMVQPLLPRRPDIHTGAQTDCVQPFENGYIVRIILMLFFHMYLIRRGLQKICMQKIMPKIFR